MLHSNPNFESSPFPDRTASGPAGFGAPRAAADEAEMPKVPVLGKTLLFRGELTAEEDVILQGRVEGSIRHARNLIIGTDGSVLGDVYAAPGGDARHCAGIIHTPAGDGLRRRWAYHGQRGCANIRGERTALEQRGR